jgi:hypothetical protein
MTGPEDSEVTIIYAAKTGDKWATAEVRLFRLGDEPYEVDYWKIDDKTRRRQKLHPRPAPDVRGFCRDWPVLLLCWVRRRLPSCCGSSAASRMSLHPNPRPKARVAAVTTRDTSDGE